MGKGGHGGHACEHDHDHTDEDQGVSLRPYVDVDRVVCYNEEVNGSGRNVFKLHQDRLTADPAVQSPEGDPELLFYIPFTETVSIKSFCIHCAATNDDTSTARRVKIFTNRDDIDFETAREMPAHAEAMICPPDHNEGGSTLDYPARPPHKFTNISSIAIFIQDNYDPDGDAPTQVTYIGFKGKGTKMKRVAVEAVYESRGMTKDHKVPQGEMGNRDFV